MITCHYVWPYAKARDHTLWHMITRSCVLHVVILGCFCALPGVLPRVLGSSRLVFAVCFVWISFDFHAWANLFIVITRCECVITNCKSAHTLLSGAICTILNVLSGVLGAYECISDIHFAKIDFYFFTKLNLNLMNEDRSKKLLILSNNCLEWATYHSNVSYFIKSRNDLVTR